MKEHQKVIQARDRLKARIKEILTGVDFNHTLRYNVANEASQIIKTHQKKFKKPHEKHCSSLYI